MYTTFDNLLVITTTSCFFSLKMREVSIESIVISFVMVIALLTNIWSLTFAVDSTISQNFYKAVQYTAIPFNFLLIFLILGLLGTRNTGFSLIILIYSIQRPNRFRSSLRKYLVDHIRIGKNRRGVQSVSLDWN